MTQKIKAYLKHRSYHSILKDFRLQTRTDALGAYHKQIIQVNYKNIFK